MHFSESEIEELAIKYKERLKESVGKLPDTAPTLSMLQKWMSENLIENQEVLNLTLKKIGKGTNVKKNARSADVKRS
jgi:hypothetical protein